MKKKVLVLAALWVVAGFVSLEPARIPAVPLAGSGAGQVVVSGLAVAIAPVGLLVGCGGGSTGPSNTSATAQVVR